MFNRLSNSSAVTPLTPIKENDMNDVTVFNFRSHNVRTILIDNEPWFVAKDVAEALGYTNPSKATSDHCRGITKRYPILDALGRTQEVRIIREPDLYRLIVGSTLPAAQEFEVWVFEEVLPSIRKTGKYEMQKVSSTPVQPPLPGEIVSREFEALHRMAKLFGYEGNQAILCADKAVKKLHNLSPVALLGVELKSPDNEALMIATEIGKRLEPAVSAKAVNLALAAMDFMERFEYRAGKFEWRLTDKGKEYGVYLDTGKVHSNGTPIQQIKWRESVISLIQQYLRVQG